MYRKDNWREKTMRSNTRGFSVYFTQTLAFGNLSLSLLSLLATRVENVGRCLC